MTEQELFKPGVKLHPQLVGARGMFARAVVYRQLNGVTVASRPPKKPAKQSDKQRASRDRFREASKWAKEVLKDPFQNDFFRRMAAQLDLTNPYTAAVKHYMSSNTAPSTSVMINRKVVQSNAVDRSLTTDIAYNSNAESRTYKVDCRSRHGHYLELVTNNTLGP